jgi:hypothetical protein
MSFWTLVGKVSRLPALEAGDFIQSLVAEWLCFAHRVLPVLVLGVGHKVLAKLAALLLLQLGGHFDAVVDLVADLAAVVAGDHNLLPHFVLRLHRSGQLKSEANFNFSGTPFCTVPIKISAGFSSRE